MTRLHGSKGRCNRSIADIKQLILTSLRRDDDWIMEEEGKRT